MRAPTHETTVDVDYLHDDAFNDCHNRAMITNLLSDNRTGDVPDSAHVVIGRHRAKEIVIL